MNEIAGRIYYSDNLLSKAKRVLMSSLLLTTAFIISNLLVQFLMYAFASALGFETYINYNKIWFTDYKHWSRLSVIIVAVGAPVLCAVISWFLYALLVRNEEWINSLRLLVYWLMICLVNIFLSHLLFSPLGVEEYASAFYQSFAVAGAWFHLTSTAMSVLSVISIVLSVCLGLITGREISRFSYSSSYISTTKGKTTMLIQVFILPVILSAPVLLFLCKGLSVMRVAAIILNLAVIGLGILIRNHIDDGKVVKVNRNDVLNRLPVAEALLCGFIWFLIYNFFR